MGSGLILFAKMFYKFCRFCRFYKIHLGKTQIIYLYHKQNAEYLEELAQHLSMNGESLPTTVPYWNREIPEYHVHYERLCRGDVMSQVC